MSQDGAAVVPTGRGGALDALRLVAALLIVLYHYGMEAPTALPTLHPVFARGYLATDFFLILSGFVLGRAYGGQVLGGQVDLAGFLRRRLTRIWPGQLVVLAGLAACVALAAGLGVAPGHPENFTPRALLMQAFLIQAWGIEGGGGWNHQSWSLSALVVCYAAFPAAWRWIGRNASPSTQLALGLTAVMLGDLLCVTTLGRHIYDLDFHFGVVRAAPLFLLGVCIAQVVEQETPTEPMARRLAWMSVAALVALQGLGRFDLPSILAIATLVLALGRLPVRRPSRALEVAAKLSFALFITHALTGLVWFGALDVLASSLVLPSWARWILWAAALPAAFVVAALFHRFVDEPLQRWLAPRLIDRPRGAEAAA
ncbi:MAG: acyltransferase family protein [Pseudomonadota bacterium]